MPLLLSLTIPQDFIVISPVNYRYTHKVELTFTGGLADETQAIQIANAQVAPGLEVMAREMIVYQGEEETEDNRVGQVSIGAENILRTVLRRSGGGGSNIPLLPLATLFVSVASLTYQQFLQRRQEEEKKTEQKKQSAKSGLERLRQAIKDGQIELANQIFEKTFQEDLSQYLEVSDLRIAQRLLNIATGNLENASSETFHDNWLEDAAAALLYAAEHNPKDRQFLDSLFRRFPLDKITNEDVRNKLGVARSVLGNNIPVQTREWPIHPQKVSLLKFMSRIDGAGENPFPCERAEEDTPHLFAEKKALFWSEHSLFKTLRGSRGATLVAGKVGSGKTALALALGEYHYITGRHTMFSCYLRGTPRPDEMHNALARRLLSFIECLPSFLILLGDQQRELLAQVLVAELGKDIVLSWLGYASQSNRWKWLEAAGNDETKRKIWEAETSTHLKLLRDAVAASTPCAFSDYQWMIAFMTCIRSLDFEKAAYIVIDAGDEFTWDWYDETILRQQHRRTEINLHTITFHLPWRDPEGQMENDWLNRFELKWDEDQLKSMTKWRWGTVYDDRPLASLFGPNAFERLIQSSKKNPLRFIRIWNALFQSGPRMPVTEEDVQKAKEHLP